MMKQLTITIGTKLITNEYEETNVGFSINVKDEDTILQNISGNEKRTTHNRTTMKAIIQSLEAIASSDTPFDIKIISDNYHIVKGINFWYKKWLKNSWKNSKGILVKNIDLWKKFIELTFEHSIEAIWQTSYHEDLDRCKRIAKAEVSSIKYRYGYPLKRRELRIVKKTSHIITY